jgi:hypothetical protein
VREVRENEGFISLLKDSAIVTAAVLVCALVSALLITAAIFPTADPARLSVPLSVALLCIAAMATGLISAKRSRSSPLAAGLISGVMLELFVLIAALFLGHKGMVMSPGTRVIFFLLIIPLALAGTLIGNMKLTKKRCSTIRRR